MSKRTKRKLATCRTLVENALDLSALEHRCSMPIDGLFADLGGQVRGKPGAQHAFRGHDSPVLAVAHCDTVQSGHHFAVTDLPAAGETRVFCPQLDDRLGVYTIMDLLPKLGIHLDILLTENEELGQSTAEDFETDRDYGWIVEFDRAGADAVSYQYDWDDQTGELFQTGFGSFSDISCLEHCGCKAVNIGIGYYDEHSTKAYFIVEEYVDQIARFVLFYRRHKAHRYPHEPAPCQTGRSSHSGHSGQGHWWDTWETAHEQPADNDQVYWCEDCGIDVSAHSVYAYAGEYMCPDCGGLVEKDDEVPAWMEEE